ncbi:hypothetical protein [Halopiger xanaduensis]|uniref:Uncharacterized protein n=1 Tax=Halopiger xanaduensis (strain DSM 18323 / JCM 14033 / SH-6) TaxID=797210 RepID=F8DA85_HALXS|nr:hypothetical protein [Halopiger xanaduensis]AEH38157.1 hypothetical protein Halxa_3546 [Halopiger xanaduensis SH-6]
MPADSDDDPDDADLEELDLSDAEEAALHDLQLGIEHVHRAYGTLLEFHHQLGHAMDRMSDAEDALREAGHEEWADRLRDDHLPAGAISDQWTYELVEEFSTEFLEEVDEFEGSVREELADGIDHVTERRQKRALRERARRSDSGESPD